MVDREVFDRRLAKLEELLRTGRELAAVELEPYLADKGLQARAERCLQLLAECALDLANHLIADRGWQTPTTYREAFQILAGHGVVPRDLTERMEGWAGLRNILVHLYLEVDQARLHEILRRDLDDIELFARCLARDVG